MESPLSKPHRREDAPPTTPYEEKIIKAFQDVCEKTGEGASPSEVTSLMRERNEISELDTVIDIERLMRGLRNRGLL